MFDAKLIQFTDELTTAVNEVFKERGFDVNVSLADVEDPNGGKGFYMIPNKGCKPLSQEIVDSVIDEAAKRICDKK